MLDALARVLGRLGERVCNLVKRREIVDGEEGPLFPCFHDLTREMHHEFFIIVRMLTRSHNVIQAFVGVNGWQIGMRVLVLIQSRVLRPLRPVPDDGEDGGRPGSLGNAIDTCL